MTLAATPALGRAPASFDEIEIIENVGFAIASLAGRRGAALDASGLFAEGLPGPGESTTGDPWSAIWAGPDQWFVFAPIKTHEDIERRLRAAFGGAASLTDQTGAWVVLEATGPRLPAMMERLTMLDTQAMAVGAVGRSIVDHLSVYIWRRADGYTFIAPRSSARSLHHTLTTAAGSI